MGISESVGLNLVHNKTIIPAENSGQAETLVLIGGYINDSITNTIEAVGGNCPKLDRVILPDFHTLSGKRISALTDNGTLVSCSDHVNNQVKIQCGIFNFSSKEWKLSHKQVPGIIQYDSIGFTIENYVIFQLSEILQLGFNYIQEKFIILNTFKMPFGACYATMNHSSQVVMVGGYYQSGVISTAYFLDINLENHSIQAQLQLPQMHDSRVRAGCSFIDSLNGSPSLIVAGGSNQYSTGYLKTVEYLKLKTDDQGNLKPEGVWTSLGSMKFARERFPSVEIVNFKLVIAGGPIKSIHSGAGVQASDYLDSDIFDTKNFSQIRNFEISMSQPRYGHTSAVVTKLWCES